MPIGRAIVRVRCVTIAAALSAAASAAQIPVAQAVARGDAPVDRCVEDMPQRVADLRARHGIRTVGVGVIRAGRVALADVYGIDPAGAAAAPTALFNVASLTKPVVAIVVLRLVDRGEWSLDAPLANYWIDPDVAADPRSRELTTRHVLQHRTGFPNWRTAAPDGRLAFEFAPGEREQYSGEGMEYLRKALERRFEVSLDLLGERVLLQPLGLADTHFVWNDERDPARFAGGYDANGDRYDLAPRRTALASDDLLTTVGDYTTFAAAVVRGSLLSAAMQAELPRGAPGGGGVRMGMGWQVVSGLPEGRSAWLHTGTDEGTRALVMLAPEAGQGIVVLTNSDRGGETFAPLVVACLSDGADIVARLDAS